MSSRRARPARWRRCPPEAAAGADPLPGPAAGRASPFFLPPRFVRGVTASGGGRTGATSGAKGFPPEGGRTTSGASSAGVPWSPASSACASTFAPKMRSNAMPVAPPGRDEGSVLMTSPRGLRRAFRSARPWSKSVRSNAARTRHSATPRRTFSRSRCSSYSVKTARTCASSSSRSSGSSSTGGAGEPIRASRSSMARVRRVRSSPSSPRDASPSSDWMVSSASTSASRTWSSSVSRPSRSRSSRSSAACASWVMRSWPKRPDSPLSEWAARKMPLMRSGSASWSRASSSASRSRPSASRISVASATNSASALPPCCVVTAA